MKHFAVAICCLLLSATALPSVDVEKITPRECTQLLRIAVTLGGKPVTGANVSLRQGFFPEGDPSLFTSTNGGGMASVPKLAPGNYRADISCNGIRSEILDEPVAASLFLQVVPKLEVSTVSIDLEKPARELWRADDAFSKQLEAASRLPIHDRLRIFQETIVDSTGTRIRSAKTWVVQGTAQRWEVVFRGTTDVNGQRSGQLRDGRYIAICSIPGFRSALAPFEVHQMVAENCESSCKLEKQRNDTG